MLNPPLENEKLQKKTIRLLEPIFADYTEHY